MASQSLVLSDPNLLAEFVRESDLRNFFEARFAAPPDLAALLFRNGELIDAFKGVHFSTGGFVNAIKSIAGGSSHIAIMLADLKPFPVQLPFHGVSKDDLQIAGLATLELQVNPEKPSNILGMMGGVSRSNDARDGLPLGRRALSRTDVLDRIAPHLADRVFEAAIRRVNANEIRGDRGLQDKIQADIMKEVERITGDLGLLVRSVSVEWAINEAERDAFQRAEINRQQTNLDTQLELLKRDVARQSEAVAVKVASTVNQAKLESASEDELAHMVLNSEITFLDAREQATRRQEMDALAHEIQILRTERAALMERDLSNASHQIDLKAEAGRLRKAEREIERLDAQHAQEMKKSGAYNDLEIHERTERLGLEIAKLAAAQSAANLRTLMDLEQDTKDRDANRDSRTRQSVTESEIALKRAETDSRTAQLQAGAKMTPEQIMAINAGLSPDVAEVLKEQARANAAGGQNTMDAMRELIRGAAEERDASRRHELDILKAGMAGATGVAHGAGGKSGGTGTGPEADAASTIECPKCARVLSAKANFCTGCGHKLRT